MRAMSPTTARRARKRRQRALGVIAAVVATALLARCWASSDDHPVLFVRNETGQTVDIVWINAGAEFVIIHDLAPGLGYSYDQMAECLAGTLIARGESGRKIAQAEGPFCRPGE